MIERIYWDQRAKDVGPLRAAWDDDDLLNGIDACTDLVDRLAPGSHAFRALDVAVGPGRVASFLNWPRATIVGVDISLVMLAGYPGIVADARNLPFPPDTFDAAYSILTLQHLVWWEQAIMLAEMARTMKPGGRMLAQFTLGEPSHAGPFSYPVRQEVGEGLVRSAGLTVEDVEMGSVRDNWLWVYALKP